MASHDDAYEEFVKLFCAQKSPSIKAMADELGVSTGEVAGYIIRAMGDERPMPDDPRVVALMAALRAAGRCEASRDAERLPGAEITIARVSEWLDVTEAEAREVVDRAVADGRIEAAS